MKNRILALIILVLLATRLNALVLSDSFGTATASVTVTYNSGTNQLSWNYTHNGITGGSGYAASTQLYRVSGGSGSTSDNQTLFTNSSSAAVNVNGTTTATASSWYMLQVYFTGPSGTSKIARAWIQAVATCKAYFPATSNSTAYAIHYRVVHSIDGVVGTVIVPAGGSVAQSEFTVSCGGTYRIEWQQPDAVAGQVGDGTWNVVEGQSADPDGWQNTTGAGTTPAPVEDTTPDLPPVPAPDPETVPPAPAPPAAPWQPATPSTTDSERLDKQTYKQGVDKIVGELQKQTTIMQGKPESEATSLYEAAKTAALAAAEVEAGKINAALPSSITGITAPSSTEAGASDVLYTATVSGEGPQKLLGGNSIEFKMSGLAPNWKTWAGWFREAMLFGMGLGFAFFMQRKFEMYYLAWWGVTEKTTKPEVLQVTVPKVGWGKQIATALIVTGAFVGCIAIVITAVNSNFASLIGGGTTVTNAMAGLTTSANAIFAALGVIYGFMNAFIPIAAVFQFTAAQYTISWLMAPLWSLALTVAKYVHV